MGWFSDRIVRWQREHGRHDLPWQGTRDPYRIWVSEVMLQQTQVASVVGYFQRFVARFPDLHALAAADLDDVMRQWSGLGYYSRARNLHACARKLADELGGEFPRCGPALSRLPGVGRSTGAAIAVFAHGAREPILDGNVRRVLCRFFAVEGDPGQAAVQRRLWEIAERELPRSSLEQYTQGLMDLGATVCTRARPACERCPLARRCLARAQGITDRLPHPRARRASPQRSTRMLILCRGDEVLLERRPSTGIWGGLWSLPQVDADPGPSARGYEVLAREELPAFEHAFTHFRLRVEPLLLAVRPAGGRGARDAPGEVWMPLSEVQAAALPAPVKALLLRLRDRPGGPLRPRDAVPGTGAPATGAPAGRAAPSAVVAPSARSAGTRTGGSPPTRRGRSAGG
ncbi:MAG TPA: A/G-specific adenine glycosylase [Burkholderiaceae bacterium]